MSKAREPMPHELHERLYALTIEDALAAWTFALSTSPSVSTKKRWRFVPFTFLPGS
jgi:hypothetical protein